ncbi:DUF551 domain-containing protein, partial [Actinoplanes sp. NPDC004185]
CDVGIAPNEDVVAWNNDPGFPPIIEARFVSVGFRIHALEAEAQRPSKDRPNWRRIVKLPDQISIRVKRPEDYDGVHAELVAEDFLATHDGGNWQYDIADGTAPNWISVNEQLPECSRKAGSLGVEALIWPATESGERTAFFGRRISRTPSFYRYRALVHRVTHWMPLPGKPTRAEDLN